MYQDIWESAHLERRDDAVARVVVDAVRHGLAGAQPQDGRRYEHRLRRRPVQRRLRSMAFGCEGWSTMVRQVGPHTTAVVLCFAAACQTPRSSWVEATRSRARQVVLYCCMLLFRAHGKLQS